MNDEGGNGASCGGVKVRMDTTKLPNMAIARFGDVVYGCWPVVVSWSLLQLLHPFNGLFSRTTWVSRHQKSKPFWSLLEHGVLVWRWHQLDHTQIICTSLQADNHASTSPLSFYRLDALPAVQTTAWKHWRQCFDAAYYELHFCCGTFYISEILICDNKSFI